MTGRQMQGGAPSPESVVDKSASELQTPRQDAESS